MYSIDVHGQPKGYGFVKDYQGNIYFYGSIKECEEFISRLEEVVL